MTERGGGPAADVASLATIEAPALYRFALALTRDPVAAEDLVQETFVRALEQGSRLDGIAAPGAWLRRVLHNLAVDRMRRSAHELLVEEVDERWRDDRYTVEAETVVMRAEARDELEDALVRLPFDQRSVVLLHDVEGLTMREIAEIQGVGLPAAKQRLRRGRMALVTALAAKEERRVALAGVPLRCWDARRRISDYLDGELSGPEAALVEKHLATCPTCPPLYAALTGTQAALGGLRDPDRVVPAGLAARIVERLPR